MRKPNKKRYFLQNTYYILRIIIIILIILGILDTRGYLNKKIITDIKNNIRSPSTEEVKEEEPVNNEYPDYFGHIKVENTNIDYPVVKGIDNTFYLDHRPDMSFDFSGSIYADYRCNLSDKNLILYGHNLKTGTMFTALKEYQNIGFYNEHKTIEFIGKKYKYKYKVCNVIVADINTDTVPFQTFDKNADKEIYEKWQEMCNDLSIYPNNIIDNKNTITLITCEGNIDSKRVIVQGKLIDKEKTNE